MGALGIGAIVMLGACEDPSGTLPPGDAGVMTRPPPEAPRSPNIADIRPERPAHFDLLPCPSGWRTVTTSTDAPAYCDPWPASGRETCMFGNAHFPGEPGCAAIGTPCDEADLFAVGLPPTGVLYVDPSAGPGGSGSRSAPFRSIGEAIGVAPASTTIALAKGTFVESIDLPSGVGLFGACVAQTTLTSTAGDTITLASGSGAVSNLTITGAGAGVRMRGSSLSLDGVEVRSTGGYGLVGSAGIVDLMGSSVRETGDVAVAVQSGTAKLDRVVVLRPTNVGLLALGVGARIEASRTAVLEVIRGSRLRPADQAPSFGVGNGAASKLEQIVSEAASGSAVFVDASGFVEITDAVLIETRASPSGGDGIGVNARAGASLSRVRVERSRSAGVLALDAGRVEVDRVLVSNVLPDPRSGLLGVGLIAGRGGSITGAAAWVEEAREAGIGAFLGGRVDLTDFVVREIHANEMGLLGTGIALQDSSLGSFERGVISGYDLDAILVASASQLSGADLTISDGRGQPVKVPVPDGFQDGAFGYGLEVFGGGRASIARTTIVRPREIGIRVNGDQLEGSPSSVTLEDVAILDVQPNDRGFGVGVHVVRTAELDGTSVVVRGSRGVGVFVNDARGSPVARLRDVVVEGTIGAPTLEGFGVFAWGASVELERVMVRETEGVGLVAREGTTLSLRDVVVREGRPIAGEYFGWGVVADYLGRIDAERLQVQDVLEVGVLASGGGAEIALADVSVENVRAGACVDDGRCPFPRSAICAGAIGGGHVLAERFAIRGCTTAAIQIATDGAMDLFDGVLADSVIGVNVQVDAFDLSRLRDLGYENVGTPVDSSLLAIPAIDRLAIDL